MVRNIINTLLFLLFVSNGFAQIDAELFKTLKEKYPHEAIVDIENNVTCRYYIENGKVYCSMESRVKQIYLKNLTAFNATRTTFLTKFIKLASVEAYVYNPNGVKYKKTKVTEYKEKNNVDNSNFYDDEIERIYTFPGTTEGSVIEFNTTHIFTLSQISPPVYLQKGINVNNFKLTIEADNAIVLKLVEKHIDTTYKFTKTITKNKTIYTWEKSNVPKTKDEEYQVDEAYYVPHVIPIVDSYMFENKKISVLSNVSDLYKWYASLIDSVNIDHDDAEIKNLADSIKMKSANELDAVKNVYEWVQNNIKYIAFEYEYGGYIPRNAKVIIKKRYGDCKDNTSLMHEILYQMGIKSYFTWIGTNKIPYSYYEVYTPLTNNHMILCYKNNGNYYFLDATGQFYPIDKPSSFIQGKEALIAIDKDNYEIYKVPVMKAETNLKYDSTYFKLNAETIVGKGRTIVTGYNRIELQNTLMQIADSKQKEYFESFLQKGSNKFLLSDYSTSKIETYNDTITIDYTFELPNYIKKIQNEIIINLNLNKLWEEQKIEKDRETPLLFKHVVLQKANYCIEIPSSMYVSNIPDPIVYNNGSLHFSIKYELKDNYLQYKHELWHDNIIITDKIELIAWNEFVDLIGKSYKKSIVLKLK